MSCCACALVSGLCSASSLNASSRRHNGKQAVRCPTFFASPLKMARRLCRKRKRKSKARGNQATSTRYDFFCWYSSFTLSLMAKLSCSPTSFILTTSLLQLAAHSLQDGDSLAVAVISLSHSLTQPIPPVSSISESFVYPYACIAVLLAVNCPL